MESMARRNYWTKPLHHCRRDSEADGGRSAHEKAGRNSERPKKSPAFAGLFDFSLCHRDIS